MVEVPLDRLRGCITGEVSTRLDDIRSYLVSAAEHLETAKVDAEFRLQGTNCALSDLSFAIEDSEPFDPALTSEVEALVTRFNETQDLNVLEFRINALAEQLLSRQTDSIMACLAGEAPPAAPAVAPAAPNPALLEAQQVVADFRKRWPGIVIPDPGPEPQPLEGPLEPPNIEVKGTVWAIRTAEGNAKAFAADPVTQRRVLQNNLDRLLPRREFWERGVAKRITAPRQG